MNFKDAIKTCLKKKYATFSGRASRSEFWFFHLFNLIFYAIFIFLAFSVTFQFFWVLGIFVIAVILPSLAVLVRRLHDVNKSGWNFLLPLPFNFVARLFALSNSEGFLVGSLIFQIIGLGISIYLLVLYCTHGDKKNNRFGKNIYKKTKKRR